MTKVVIATHGKLAKGFKHSIEFIMGEQPNLVAICAYTPECTDFILAINNFIKTVSLEEHIVFTTDLLGGSVNNDLMKICQRKSRLHLISGINMPLLIQLLIQIKNSEINRAITESIDSGVKGITDCKDFLRYNKSVSEEFENF